MSRAVCFALAAFAVTVYAQLQPTDPVMGIFTDTPAEFVRKPPNGQNHLVEAYYPHWLATAGIRSIPIPWNATWEVQLDLLKKVNGVLFPGGDLMGEGREDYFGYVQKVFDQAVAWNRAGDPFVIWGTCQGYQIVCACAARNISVIEPGFVGVDGLMMSLNFTSAQPTSRMFGVNTTREEILNIFATENSTLNWHSLGVTPSGFDQNPAMGKMLSVLSTNTDLAGRVFTSAVEGKDGLSIYATQFHPERPLFELNSRRVGHTVGDIKVSQWLALFIKEQLQRNNHTFPTPEEAEAHSIHNYPIVNYGENSELYWIQYPPREHDAVDGEEF